MQEARTNRRAPAAKIIPVEAKSNSNANLYAAVDTAVANGATVVSMSWVAVKPATKALLTSTSISRT